MPQYRKACKTFQPVSRIVPENDTTQRYYDALYFEKEHFSFFYDSTHNFHPGTSGFNLPDQSATTTTN